MEYFYLRTENKHAFSRNVAYVKHDIIFTNKHFELIFVNGNFLFGILIAVVCSLSYMKQ